ncbi:MAG: hypothetical protein V1784_07300, partial [bacterium]
MPYEIKFDKLPAGYVAESAPKGSTTVKVQSAGFASSQDGDRLIQFLEGISEGLLTRLPKNSGIKESQIDHLLAIIRKDCTATVYVNEVAFVGQMQSKKDAIKKDDPVFTDDIADVIKLTPKDIIVPPDAGIVIILSAGWRKGVFFDYRPLMPEFPGPRDYDVEVLLGQIWSHLAFQERLRIDDKQFAEFLRQQWFPFISLGAARIRTMVSYVTNGWELDQMLDEVEIEVKRRGPTLLSMVGQGKIYKGHRELLKNGIEHF